MINTKNFRIVLQYLSIRELKNTSKGSGLIIRLFSVLSFVLPYGFFTIFNFFLGFAFLSFC